MSRAAGVSIALAFAGCGGGGGFPDAPRPIDAARPGTFAVAWTIEDMTMQPISCMTANADQVLINVENATTSDSFAQPFACDLGNAVSGAIPPGTYNFKFTLRSGSTLLATAPDQTGVAIQATLTAQLKPLTFVLP